MSGASNVTILPFSNPHMQMPNANPLILPSPQTHFNNLTM
jgi:hypothetical protein